MHDLPYLTLSEASELIADRSISPLEYTSTLLDRINELDPSLHAFTNTRAEGALRDARRATDEIRDGYWKGPFHGIPYGLKDIIDFEGLPTTAGSASLENSIAGQHSTVARKLNDAGGICMGKLATHEFAAGGTPLDQPWPPAKNPWNLSHDPGGSSSGSAVALSAGLLPATIGTDTGGSIRGPATSCGIVGMKPAFGRISRNGVLPLSHTFDHVGPMARSVKDVAILLQVLSGHDAADAHSVAYGAIDYTGALRGGVENLRVGFIRHFHDTDTDDVDPAIATSIEAASRTLSRLGVAVEDISVEPLAAYASVYDTIMLSEAYRIHRRRLTEDPSGYGELTRARLLKGATITEAEYSAAVQLRQNLIQKFTTATSGFDAIICASSMDTPAPLNDRKRLVHTYSRQARKVFNVVNAPAMSIPVGFTDSGMPLGMQIATASSNESAILTLGHAYEQETGWLRRTPPLDH
ncbi:MAG TPA: amidase [Terrimesophilobacter sp.]|nr:amidase [Terrimesophilobacter sp.]HRP99032.1 amidase [Terrimesophilobacter sp.]